MKTYRIDIFHPDWKEDQEITGVEWRATEVDAVEKYLVVDECLPFHRVQLVLVDVTDDGEDLTIVRDSAFEREQLVANWRNGG